MSYDPYGAYPTVQHIQPQRKPKRWPWVLVALLGLCVGGAVIAAATNGNAKTPGPIASKAVEIAERAVSAAPTAPPVKGKPPAKVTPTLGAGTWEVGTEAKAGTWTTIAVGHCYWARLTAFDGDFDSITANGNLDPGDHGRITVKKTDKGLELSGDCTWTLAGAK